MQTPSSSESPSDYHVSRRGQILGVFPLETIRGRRATGELTGEEFVWRADMAGWHPIDQVLGPPPLRVAAEKKTTSRPTVWWIGVVIAVVLLVGGVDAYAAYWSYQEVKKVVVEARHQVLAGAHAEPEGMELARPITPDPQARRRESRWPIEREFRERHYLEGYRRDGLRAPGNDAIVQQYLETWLTVSFGHPTVDEERQLTELGARLLADPEFRDPIVLSILATNGAAANRDEKRRLLERAVAGMPGSRHRPYPWFCTVVSYAATLPKNAAPLAELDATALRLLEEAVKEGGIPVGDQEILADNLVHGWAETFFSRQGPGVRKIFEKAGPDWRWLNLVLAGEDHINLAWKARGGGYANTVNEQGWRGFAEELATAREHLEAAWSLDPSRPLAPARLITVSMGQSRPDEMRLWFERALAAECDHRPAWRALRWGLRPRWFGSHEAMLALGDMALATGRYDTELPRQFWMVADELAADAKLPDGETLYARPDLWPRLSRMFEGYVAADLPAPLRDRWRTDYACAAYSAKKYDVARAQLEALGWEPMPSRLNVRGRDVPHLANEVAARTGSHATRVAEAESLLAEGKAVRAREIYGEILAGAPDVRTRGWAEMRRQP